MSYAVRGGACDCLGEIVVKGMDAGVKVGLVESMASVIQSSGVLVDLEVRGWQWMGGVVVYSWLRKLW